jgi:hypothetical protein
MIYTQPADPGLGIAMVEVWVNDRAVAVESQPYCYTPWMLPGPGTYRFRLRATAADGRVTEHTVTATH